MMMPILEVASKTGSYPVYLGQGLIANAGRILRQQPFTSGKSTCAIISDETVASLYAEPLLESLRAEKFAPVLITVPAGENSKSLAEVGRIADRLAEAGLDRHSLIVALGGGVVGDLAGFVAAIYYRGLPSVQVPTTVVAQVDSSVGGKTGVNLARGKNLLGAFHPPALVLADVDTLATLPEREFNEGVAEAIKHAVIRDGRLLANLMVFDRRNAAQLTALVRRNLEIKAEIVARDEFESSGERALLNFGHTIGHGIEQAAGYGRLLHGEAVSLGMIAAARLSVRKAGLPPSHCTEIVAALQHFKLPTSLPEDFPISEALGSMARDKKFAAGSIRFVLCPAIGRACLSEPGQITWDDLLGELEGLRAAP